MTPGNAGLEIRAVSKSFGTLEVLRDITISVHSGEFVAVVGPSGSGKSTLFDVISGLEQPTAGEVIIGGEPASIDTRNVAYMPQHDLMFPWRTVLENTALGLEAQGMSKKVARSRAGELFSDFGLDGFQSSYPSQLSGGMRQRAAMLRTVVLGRPILLLDEPFGALDALTRTEMQLWLAQVWQRHRWTVVMVTHDIREAVLLSDTVYALSARPGEVAGRFDVSLPRPRGAANFAAPEFISLEVNILQALTGQR